MKTRVISGLVGLAILLAVLTIFYTNYFNAIVLVVYCIALWEIYNTFKKNNTFSVTIILALAGVCYFLASDKINTLLFVAIAMSGYAFITVMGFKNIDFMTLSSNTVFGLYVFIGFYSVLYIKKLLPFEKFGYDGLFLFVLCCAIAWGSDVFAYFSGFLFGKHKLAPNLSPKKTVEGFVGGICGSVVLSLVFLEIYSIFKPTIEKSENLYKLNAKYIVYVVIMSAIFGAISVIGDLFASAVKRQVGIKDYGNIMPGHGGVLDRFDSFLILAPFISCLSMLISNVGGIFNV